MVVASAPLAAAAAVAALLTQAWPGSERPVWPLGVALLAAGVIALFWWRARPVAVLAVTGVVAVAYYVAGFPPGPEVLPFVIALAWTAAAGRRVLAAIAALAGGAVAVLTDVALGRPENAGDLAAVAATLAAILALGEVVRMRRAALNQRIERATQAERLRIAGELHDVISHQLAVINLQAEAALARQGTRPELAAQALSVISVASREALADVRVTLGAIRETEHEVLEPVAGVADLPRLIDRMATAAAGVTVEATLPEPPEAVPPGVQRAAVRIVQESLTNAIRHARPTRVSVLLAYEPGAVVLEVVNDGVAHGGRVPGNGISGMRARAAALSGQLTAGPCGGGRFRVHARLPWGAGS